jgi:hypothetical protein
MKNVLMLTSVMKRGFGVSVVAREVADRMGEAGWKMFIGCLEVDEFYAADDVIVLRPSSQTIFEFCQANTIEIVVAQTSPYFEVLPALEMWIPTVVFEHGDPTPTMFEHDVADREQLKVHKLKRVYPKVDEVLASFSAMRSLGQRQKLSRWAVTTLSITGRRLCGPTQELNPPSVLGR